MPDTPSPCPVYNSIESFQLQAGHLALAKTLPTAHRLYPDSRADETLHQGDVGTVEASSAKPFGKTLSRRSLVACRVLVHRGIRLQQDVDGRDRVWLGIRRRRHFLRPGDGTGHRSYEQE